MHDEEESFPTSPAGAVSTTYLKLFTAAGVRDEVLGFARLSERSSQMCKEIEKPAESLQK